MINRNKLYSSLLSIDLIYIVMTIFELVFFAFVVIPVITESIISLMNSYKSANPIIFNFDPNPIDIIITLNKRSHLLINDYNLSSYLIMIILLLLLISLFVFLYVKIGVIEHSECTEYNNSSLGNSSLGSRGTHRRDRSVSESELSEITDIRDLRNLSIKSGLTRRSVRFFYLRHAIRCAVSTITCLIIFQIFFYYYGLEFKYVGSKNELIVLFIETILYV